MALTKNSRAAAARAKAAELARAAQSREADLLRLAGEYFIHQGEAGAVGEDAKAKGLELIEAAKKKAQELEDEAFLASIDHEMKAHGFIVQMLEAGAAAEDVAARVDMSVAVVRKIRKAAANTKKEVASTTAVEETETSTDQAGTVLSVQTS